MLQRLSRGLKLMFLRPSNKETKQTININQNQIIMKKIFFSLVAVAAVAACAKTEPVYTDVNSEIKLAPVASIATKANGFDTSIIGNAYPTAEHFTVKGYWANEPAGTSFAEGSLYLDHVDFAKGAQYWEGSAANYYWPKNGSLRFACYSPTEVEGGTFTHDLATDTWTAVGYTQPSLTTESIDLMVAKTPASYTAATAAENVSVVFEHALSWITLKVVAKDADAAAAFTINKVTINDVNTVAKMVAQYPAKTWSEWNTPADYVVYEGAQNVATGEPQVIENTANGTIVIPQATTTVTIEYTQNELKTGEVVNTPQLDDQVITVSLALDAELNPWQAGKHYVYTLIFSLDEIVINPSVVDWEEVIVADKDADITRVATSAELVAAAAKGGDIVLTSDIEITETVVVNGDCTLELNGNTITNNANNTEMDVLVVAADATLTIIGDGKIKAVSGNEGYAMIVDGTVVINDGTFEAGVDQDGAANAVVYVRGNGKAYINGGYFPNEANSKYVLNKKDADRATTVIEVTGGTFENFNPGNNAAEGTGTNFLKAGYKVVENGTTYTVVAE